MKRICVFGTFDILHVAHIRFFEEAKKLGKPGAKLIVVISRDESVLQLKGKSVVFPENQRLRIVSALRVVDEVVLGNLGSNRMAIFSDIKPDVVVLGYDQWASEEVVRDALFKLNLTADIIRLPKFDVDELSSSSQIKLRIVNDINGHRK